MRSPSENSFHGKIITERHIMRLEEQVAALTDRLARIEATIDAHDHSIEELITAVDEEPAS
jgi:hypothetical protein